MIKPTQKLKKDLKRLINESFDNALESIGEEEFFYVGNNIERKNKRPGKGGKRACKQCQSLNRKRRR